jgi:putative SOS response-associated peptidase YedK
MCGRFTQHYAWKETHDLYELTAAKPPTNMRPRYNVCPTTIVDTVHAVGGNTTPTADFCLVVLSI